MSWLLLVMLTTATLSAFSLFFQVTNVVEAFIEDWDLDCILVSESSEQYETGEIKTWILENNYQIANCGCDTDPADFGLSDTVPTDGDDYIVVLGTSEQYINGSNLRLDGMNQEIIEGEGYYESDSPLIWLSDYAANQLGLHAGDTIQPVEFEYFTAENDVIPDFLVAGIYSWDYSDPNMLYVINEAGLHVVFNPKARPLDEMYSIVVPKLSDAKNMLAELDEMKVNTLYNSSWNSEIQKLQYVVDLIGLCVILLAVLVLFSLIKAYCNDRKAYYAMLRLLGVQQKINLSIICGVWMVQEILALPLGMVFAKPVVRHLNQVLSEITKRANVRYECISPATLAALALLLTAILVSCFLCIPKSQNDLTIQLREERE